MNNRYILIYNANMKLTVFKVFGIRKKKQLFEILKCNINNLL